MLIKGILQQRYVRCGKVNCACAGDPARRHGPYWYLLWWEGTRLRKRYIPRTKLEAMRQLVEQRVEFVHTLRAWRREIQEALDGLAACREHDAPA
jgi:hypothetical protein